MSVSSFSFVDNRLFNLTLMCFWCHMTNAFEAIFSTNNRAVSAALHIPQLWGVTLPQGLKFRPFTTSFSLHSEEFCYWLSRFRHANWKRLPAPDVGVVQACTTYGPAGHMRSARSFLSARENSVVENVAKAQLRIITCPFRISSTLRWNRLLRPAASLCWSIWP